MNLKKLQRGHIGWDGPGSDEEPLIDFRRMWNRLVWRVRYTIHGQRKTGWGWRLWWEWSATDVDEWEDAKCGLGDYRHAVQEEIYAAMADAECVDVG